MSAEREGLRERIAEELYAMRGIRSHWRHLTESARRIWLQDADRILSLLPQAQEPVAWRCDVKRKGVWESDLVTDARGVVQQWEREAHGIDHGLARVVPLYATPVASAPEEEREAFDPLTNMPGEYEIGRTIREAAVHDLERMRFYLTCSIGELAQRIARLRATPTEEQERRAPESEEDE